MTSNKLIRSQQPFLELKATEILSPGDWLRVPDDVRASHERFPPTRAYAVPPESMHRLNLARKKRLSLAWRIKSLLDHYQGEILALGFLVVPPTAAYMVSTNWPWVLSLTLILVVTAFVGIASQRLLQFSAWAAAIAVLTVVAFGFDGTSQFLSGLGETMSAVLGSWMTYRIIALFVLVCLGIYFIERCRGGATKTEPMPDPRGYGRFAIDDFVEKNTYGDADLAAKSELHLALSRRGHENLRFTPKFLE
jgi:hypothetical protein